MNCWDVNVTLLEKYGYTLDACEERRLSTAGATSSPTVKAGEEARRQDLLSLHL